MTHEIIVGNIGTVLVTTIYNAARGAYTDYVKLSKSNGRAGGEDVTWMRDGEPYKEFTGKTTRAEE